MAGLLTRVAAVAIAINMAVAIGLVHIHFGFFMDWNSSKKGEGMKFCLLALLMCMIVFVKGAGALSVDLWWSRAAGRRPVTGKSKGTRTNQPRATIVRS